MGQLRASAGYVDLAPRPGQWMSGYAARTYPAEGTHDPITARALLLDSEDTRLVIVSCDLVGFDHATVEDIRRRVFERCNIAGDRIVIGCTHTHSGPASIRLRGVLGMVDEGWLEQAKEKIVQLVCSLPGRLAPACFRYARTTVPGIGFNRQDASRGIDEEAPIIGIDSPDGRTIATVLNFGCHAVVLDGENLVYSADYPGAAVKRLEELRGGVGLFLQGTFGDVNPVAGHHHGAAGFEVVRRVGASLAEASEPALRSAECTREVTIGVAFGMMDTPLEAPPPPEELDRLEAEYLRNREASAKSGDRINEGVMDAYLDWIAGLRGVLAQGPAPASAPAEIGIARINDLLIVSAPFELYSDIGIAVKRALSPWKVAFVGCANGLLGYMATEWAKDQGGYGPREAFKWFTSAVTAIDRTGGEALVDAVLSLARRSVQGQSIWR